MESQKLGLEQQVLSPRFVLLLVITGFALVTVGIGLLCAINTINSVRVEQEYFQNCKDDDIGYPCNNIPKDENKCSCYSPFNIPQDITGDITFYYELETFDQTDPYYADSRDNDQLSGRPRMVPALSCGDFRYDQEMPIFPCGKVADSMFNDSFSALTLLADPKHPLQIPITYDGLLADDTTTPYHNPPADVWANFTKPKSWLEKTGNVWEKPTNITGVENPAFRAWMNTNLKRKPVWKIAKNHTLPAGPYKIFIDIFYPAQAYNGSRKFIIEGVNPVRRLSHVVIGSIALTVGIIALVSSSVLFYISKRHGNPPSKPSSYNASTLPVADRISLGPASHDYEDISEEVKLNKNH